MSDSNEPASVEPSVIDALHDLATQLEEVDSRLARLEHNEEPSNNGEGNSEGESDTRKREGWCDEAWDDFTAWVEWLRSLELHTYIPDDWDQIPLIRSELRALRWAWRACEKSAAPSFDWTTFHDTLGRALARITDWKTIHTRQIGLSGTARS